MPRFMLEGPRPHLLFCPHTLCMSYVNNTFLLVSSSVRSEQLLCFVHGQGQKTEQKHGTKNFDEFHNHSRPSINYGGDYDRLFFFIFFFYLLKINMA